VQRQLQPRTQLQLPTADRLDSHVPQVVPVKEIAFILTVGALVMAYAATLCNVGEFQVLALSTHNPSERKAVTIVWLKDHIKSCSNYQIVVIYNNLAAWLGTADNMEIRGIIYEHYKRD